ncbi:MAG: FtsQ-type POTRA domain-containing protein [Myxococcaceae bacterium]|nr:FtsQ-type POTRA domain-containing protein [Myxococcaceae bacterium]
MFRSRKNKRRPDKAQAKANAKAQVARFGRAALHLFSVMFIFAALTACGIALGRWAQQTPYFALNSIEWTGTERASSNELARMAGLALGQNIWSLDTGNVERILGSHPWVAKVTVTRHFPAALQVDIQEQEAVALLSLGELYLVNAAGVPFKRVGVGDELDLPLVSGFDRDAFTHERLESTAKLLRALDLMHAYAQAPFAKEARLSEIRVEDDGWAVLTDDGLDIRLSHEAFEPALARLAQVRAELQRRAVTAEVIRLDNRARPNWVTIQLKSTAPEKASRGKEAAARPERE